MTTVCVTFDHLGSAQQVGRGTRRRPDPEDPGSTVGYPRILRLLDELDLRATFFVEGWSLLHYPATIAGLLDRGHEVALHGWVHEGWSTLTAGDQERILSDGLAALELTGVARPGFRAPHGYLAAESVALLDQLGYHFDSSLLGPDDEPPRRPRALTGTLVNVPFAWPMVDAWQYRIRPDPLTPEQLRAAWTQLARPGNGLVTLVAHPHISGVDPAASTAFETVLRALADTDGVEVRRVGDVAADFHAAAPPGPGEPPDLDAWTAYLRARHLLPDGAAVTELPGGVSGVALRAGDVVVKQARPRLAVAGDWAADPTRILAEAEALARFPDLAPQRLDVDTRHLVLAMAFVDGTNWKDELLAGQVDPAIGRLAGAALRRIADRPPGEPDGAERFEQLRLAPYFGGLPDLAPEIAQVVDRLRSSRERTVHGDFSPKNILVRRPAGAAPQITVLDWEVSCAGDPTFDLAFLLTHLVAKSIHRPAVRPGMALLCRAVLDEYGPVDEAWLAQLLGALLLARVDGLSPLTYLSPGARDEVRTLGRDLLTGRTEIPWR